MAEKPVPNALTLELEPVVAENLQRHLATEDLWFGHDYVPWEQGENFAFLGGRDWEPSDVTLPKHITDALEILLITKDNVAGYHRELVEHFILDEQWGRFLGRWTAEEHLHAIVLRNYLVVTREIDPSANEDVRVEHVVKGYRADKLSQIETLGGWRNGLPMYYARSWFDALAPQVDWTGMRHGVLWSVLFTVVLVGLAYRHFRRKDILS
jgi:acyl-[acyl-carrier-protein] desaturase